MSSRPNRWWLMALGTGLSVCASAIQCQTASRPRGLTMATGSQTWQQVLATRETRPASAVAAFGLVPVASGLTVAVLTTGATLEPRATLQVWSLGATSKPQALALPPQEIALRPGTYDLGAHADQIILAAGPTVNPPGTVAAFAPGGWSSVSNALTSVPVELAESQLVQIKKQPIMEWALLDGAPPCEAWLFDPRVQEGSLNGQSLLTFGAANGQTAVFSYDLKNALVHAIGIVPGAVNAVIAPANVDASPLRMYYRVADERWSGPDDSTAQMARGSLGLLLRSADLAADGTVVRSGLVVHPALENERIYAFDVTSGPDDSLVFALIHNEAPSTHSLNTSATIVRVSASGDAVAIARLPLTPGAMPVAIRVRLIPQGIVIATQMRIAADELMAVYVYPLTP